MVPVTVTIQSRDNCGIAENKIIAVNSNEPVNGIGDGNTDADWQILDNTHVNLRSERSGPGVGRVYTITVQSTDIHGNTSTATTTVTVPHDMSTKANRLSVKLLSSTSSGFLLNVTSEDKGQVALKVVNIHGRPIETRANLQPNQNVSIGRNYGPGIYVISVTQGKEMRQVKVVK
jgi:hypothetical protein